MPKLNEVQHSLVFMNPHNDTVAAVRELPEKGARQHGRFVLARRGLKEKEKKDEPKKGDKKKDGKKKAKSGN